MKLIIVILIITIFCKSWTAQFHSNKYFLRLVCLNMFRLVVLLVSLGILSHKARPIKDKVL